MGSLTGREVGLTGLRPILQRPGLPRGKHRHRHVTCGHHEAVLTRPVDGAGALALGARASDEEPFVAVRVEVQVP